MKRTRRAHPLVRCWSVRLLCLGLVLGAGRVGAQAPAPPALPGSLPPGMTSEQLPQPRPEPVPAVPQPSLVLSLNDALRWAIEHNPALATVRKQRGIAAAGIIIANTYPFNPIFQHFVWGANGPSAAGVTNHVFNEHTMRLDVELFHQGRYRRAQAAATLSRTEWDIATQELLVGIQVVRAYYVVLHRQARVRLQQETLQLQEQVFKQVEKLVENGQLRRNELLLARMDVMDAKAALATANNLLTVAWNDLRRLLGMVNEECSLAGTLEMPAPDLVESDLTMVAEERRPDLRSREVAIKEADAALQFQIANRWGNPSIGPATEINETSVTFVGMWLIWSPPVINTRKGEIQVARATVARAIQDARSTQITIQQDVHNALARLKSANAAVNTFRSETLPTVRTSAESLDKLFAAGEPGVTFASLIAVRTRLLQTYGTYLDALLELAQARADLAAAVGDPSLVQLNPPQPPTAPSTAPSAPTPAP